ncbi:diguanylate cyclase (plasmid) [Azospirillum humicireducens]|uniref:Diguanylate cyclase n=1 Tax=Azospirillum humicireducens TaxID=1226968 RepID=A0A2R4VUZ3_9PROT|nr:diguanylate cyclase [Azospirillum humicireducens]AWB08259.1 diguanylate cyclase [Azospirillum humicireducens]
MLVSNSMAMISDRGVQDLRDSVLFAYDRLPVGVCIATASGMIRYANPALHGLLGCEPGGLPGRSLCEFELDCSLPQAWPARRADGTIRWVTVAEVPLPADPSADAGGQGADALRMLTVTDVDALHRQETVAGDRASSRPGPAGMPVVDALLEAAPVPLFVKDADGQYIAVNEAFSRLTGIGRADMLRRTTFALTSPDMAREHAGQDRAVMEREGSVCYEAPLCTAEGAMRMVNLTKAAFRDQHGNPMGIVGAIHELTETRPNEERLEAILEQSPIGVSVSRREDGRIIFVNTRFAELIGLSREQLIGSRARDYYLDSHQRLRVLDRLRGGGGVTNMEVQFKRADGSPFWTLFTVNQAVIQGVPVNLAWIYDYTERRSMEEALRDMASRDPLTGIYNRRSFMELARSQLARAHRFHEPLSVFVLDVDHFKRINDTFGHATGDDALRMVAAGCQAILREYDLLGRLGGEEFVVVLPGATADESRVVAERVRRHLARMPIEAPNGTFRLTASIGIAGLEGATDTLERAIHRADLALYRAKHLGRNRVAVFEPGM